MSSHKGEGRGEVVKLEEGDGGGVVARIPCDAQNTISQKERERKEQRRVQQTGKLKPMTKTPWSSMSSANCAARRASPAHEDVVRVTERKRTRGREWEMRGSAQVCRKPRIGRLINRNGVFVL